VKPLVIFGAGEIAEVAHFYFTHDLKADIAAFTVDAEYLKAARFCGLPVVPFEQLAAQFPPAEHDAFVALSYAKVNAVRAQKCAAVKASGYRLATYVSSKASVWPGFKPGENCFILEDNTVQPFVVVGDNVTLWSGNHIGHDSVIGDHCFISSHVVVSGHVRVGERSFLGVNATLRNGISIAPGTLVGAGAVIMRDTKPGEVHLAPRALLHPKSSEDIKL
jgi:sugar O-acyltransferase (sialic acid O-acetyltransferase NeuD family)